MASPQQGPPGGWQPQGPPPPGYQGYTGWTPPPRRTNGLAIASLVLGLLWLYGLGSILALVFGYTAKRQISERAEDGGGMATAGIVLGWIGTGFLILLLIGLLVG